MLSSAVDATVFYAAALRSFSTANVNNAFEPAKRKVHAIFF